MVQELLPRHLQQAIQHAVTRMKHRLGKALVKHGRRDPSHFPMLQLESHAIALEHPVDVV